MHGREQVFVERGHDDAAHLDMPPRRFDQQIVVDEAADLFLFSAVAGLIRNVKVQGVQYTPVMGSSPFWYQVWMSK